ERGQLAYSHGCTPVAHLDAQHGFAGAGERSHQRRDVLGGPGQTELPQRPVQPAEVLLEERDAPIPHSYRLDQTKARRVHGLPGAKLPEPRSREQAGAPPRRSPIARSGAIPTVGVGKAGLAAGTRVVAPVAAVSLPEEKP